MTSTTPTPTPTLDDERVDQLRRFLAHEASTHAIGVAARPPRERVRRAVAAGAVAVALGVALIGVAALATGPGASRPAAAVTIETEDGWTTVRLVDRDAAPEDVLAELRAAGIEARIRTVELPPMDENDSLAIAFAPGDDGVGAFAASGMALGSRGLMGVTVNMTADVSFQVIPDGALPGHDEPQEGEVIESDVPSEPQPGDAFADLEADGIRLGGIGDVSIRDGSGNVVVLIVAE